MRHDRTYQMALSVFYAVIVLGIAMFLWTLIRIEQTHIQQRELGKAVRCVLLMNPNQRTQVLVRDCFRSVP